MIKKQIKLHNERNRKIKLYNLIKLHDILKYVGKKFYIFEIKIKLLTESIYSEITPIIIFVLKPVLKIQVKDPIFNSAV